MISVVIPALNEQDAIVDTIGRLRRALDDAGLAPFEIIVVDDGSSDETGLRAAAAGAIVVRHPHRAGYGHSLKDGIRSAKFDTIVITDADGTYPVEAVPELVRQYQSGFDMVVGARSGSHYRESLLKMPLRWALRHLVEFTAGRKIPDINSGLRVFGRQTVVTYFAHLCDTFSFTTSLTLAYMMTGRFVGYSPIDYDRRIGTSKVRLFRDSLNTLQYILESAIYYNPMRIFLLMSAVIGLGALACFALALLTHLNVFFFLGVGGFVAAAIVFTMGLLAVLLRQIMLKTQPEVETHSREKQAPDQRQDEPAPAGARRQALSR